MDNLKLTTQEGEPKPEDKEIIRQGLLAQHKSQGHPRSRSYFSIYLKDSVGNILGGVIAYTEWNGLHIESLWVDESLRNQGWGTKIMETAEKEGVERGATFAYTDTFTWQAPEFYKKLGYSVYGKLENFPEGNSLTYYKKDLD